MMMEKVLAERWRAVQNLSRFAGLPSELTSLFSPGRGAAGGKDPHLTPVP